MNQAMLGVIILLAAAVLCAPLARRLGLGSILGYLLAGTLVGPAGFAWITQVDTILHVSEFGVVLMLFVIGLELDPRRLWAMRREVFGMGSLQLLLGSVTLILLLQVLQLPILISFLCAAALALSSTAIALQLLNERNLLPSPLGQLTFGILLFQDLAAIPLIAAVTLLAHTGESGALSTTALWWRICLPVLAIVGVVVVGRFLLSHVLRLVALSGMREIFTAFTLLLVLSVAALMQWVGLSMALGAFLAGILLAESEYRKALETDIEPFKGLLLGLFFLAVGMSINLAVVQSQAGLIVLCVMGLLALKTGGLLGVARIAGIPAGQRWQFAALLAQGGEFGFVVFGAAQQNKLLSDAQSSVLTAVVALSMALTPILLALVESWGRRQQRKLPTMPIDNPAWEQAPVIVAGFGRVGQIISRLLFARGLQVTVLDHDPDQITLIRRFGYKVFYGDATRLDLLRAAGAHEAKILVVAIDDIADSLELVDLAKQNFPQLTVMARARNVQHVFELKRRGVDIIERETFESSLKMGRQLLELLGDDAWEAKRAADRFRNHNQATLNAMYLHYGNADRMQSVAREARDELEEAYERDRKALDSERIPLWSKYPRT